jgi:hypothetical protein
MSCSSKSSVTTWSLARFDTGAKMTTGDEIRPHPPEYRQVQPPDRL